MAHDDHHRAAEVGYLIGALFALAVILLFR